MSTQPEVRVERGPVTQNEAFAIGMAKLLEREGKTIAAAELRRLHTENERLHQINQSHEMKLSVRGYEIQIEDLRLAHAELRERNAELLEALKRIKETRVFVGAIAQEMMDAAIARAEGDDDDNPSSF